MDSSSPLLPAEHGGGASPPRGMSNASSEGADRDRTCCDDDAPVRTMADGWKLLREESVRLWAIGAPIGLNILSIYGLNSLTQIFIGHVSNLALSAVAIGLSVVSNFSFGFLLGMASALETLCGQAYGAGEISMLGVYMQRSWIILLGTAVLMVPVFCFASPILVLIGQDRTVASEAGKFSIGIIPHLFALALIFPVTKFLQAQSKVMVMAYIGLVCLAFHVVLLYLFIYVFHWGIFGAAAAYDLSMWLMAIVQIVYVVGWCTDAWKGLSWAAFSSLWEFVKLSLESAVMLCLELWYVMLLTVLAGDLDNPEMAVDSLAICMNINGWEAMIFFGLNAAISVRVSNELGAGRARAAMHAVIVVIIESLAIGLTAMAAILVFRNRFAAIFTSDRDLQIAVAKIAYLLAVTMVLNSIQPVISGVAIGGGWQGLVAYINLGCYYVFGLPLGFLIGYKLHLGVLGVWAGMLCGIALQTVILLFIVWRTDWKAEAEQASHRVRLWGGDGKDKNMETEK